ncbi:hypothetical protein GA0116948_12027 [Chitinophaga costaii]|uniref:Uncharacterized protein n=1 Tax=Chitinophaga costaii TaxID=1335309 RepID=A0A1C4G2L4_9BACT|nr:hypothetical protein [Chitinophaga costaii]PUZ19788.1 hypothetical protein DCM91_20150 [Chitinophaga costaii]SCC62420.1 hypothetical protein GA0116948_12027 [Chitinophaga costaii]
MGWNYNILQLESQFHKKLMAFRLFKERGLEYTDKTFPALHPFIIENAAKNVFEVEKELHAELERAKALLV